MSAMPSGQRGGGANDVIVLDSDDAFVSSLMKVLAEEGYRVHRAADVGTMMRVAAAVRPAYAVLDLHVHGGGLPLVHKLRQYNGDARIVIVTRYASIATAVEAIRMGASDYLPKPAEPAQVAAALFGKRGAHAHAVAPSDIPLSVGRLEWEQIHRTLLETRGNVTIAARVLGMHRRTLQRKLRKHPIAH